MKISDGIEVFSFSIEKALKKYGKRFLKTLGKPDRGFCVIKGRIDSLQTVQVPVKSQADVAPFLRLQTTTCPNLSGEARCQQATVQHDCHPQPAAATHRPAQVTN